MILKQRHDHHGAQEVPKKEENMHIMGTLQSNGSKEVFSTDEDKNNMVPRNKGDTFHIKKLGMEEKQ
jgi:hypothetical protein